MEFSANFDITEYINSVRIHVYELELLKEEQSVHLYDPIAVDKALHELELEDKLLTLKRTLLDKYQRLFRGRTQRVTEEQVEVRAVALQEVSELLQQAQQQAQSPPLASLTRSTSRGNAEAKSSGHSATGSGSSQPSASPPDNAGQQQPKHEEAEVYTRPGCQWEGSPEQCDYETEYAAGEVVENSPGEISFQYPVSMCSSTYAGGHHSPDDIALYLLHHKLSLRYRSLSR